MTESVQGASGIAAEAEERAPDTGPWALLAMGASLAFLAAGIAWPGIAESLLRVLLAGLALGFFAFRALEAGLPSATVHDSYSPFEGTLADGSPPSAPDVVRDRARPLSAADDPDAAATAPVPWPVARRLLREAVRRLESGLGLRLDHPAEAARIRAMVSGPTRALLGLTEPPGKDKPPHPEDRFVPLAGLDEILDDLERL